MRITSLLEVWGANIKRQREARGMSRQDLADAVGVTRAAIDLWERGKREPRATMCIEIAKALDVDDARSLFPLIEVRAR